MTNKTPTDRAKAVVSRLHREGGVVSADPAALEQMIATEIQAESNAQLMRNRAVDRQADVAAFVRKFGQARRDTPGWPEQKHLDMRVRLIAEEFCEFLHACGYGFGVQIGRRYELDTAIEIFAYYAPISERNLPAAADGLIDLEYVILGTHETMGINSTPLWQEVQKANMAKEGGATREDGKILKPAGWRPPDITGALRRQGWSDGDADTDIGMDSDELAQRFEAVCKPIEEVIELTPTERGDKGFGSTGR